MGEIRVNFPGWLPPEIAAWVRGNGELLDEIYAAFERDGAWPAPGALQRELLAQGRRLRVVSGAEAMPSSLGARSHSPDEVRLFLFGLACVDAARPLLEQYAATLALAQSRYARPDEPARLTRADVAAHLQLDDGAMDRLSVVLLADHPFLGSGQSNLDSWDYEIDDRIVDLGDVNGLEELLALLAEQRQLGRALPHFGTPLLPASQVPPVDELSSLRGPVGYGVPVEALETYARWWQLETFLREVVYVELRARWGESWTEHLKGTAPKRAAKDAVNAYMASADAGELLAYADVSDLFGLIEDQWALFENVLLPLERWLGTVHLLRDVRNRNAHCRRPHRDDPARLQQALRDLEAGARRFYSSYLRALSPPGDSSDPVAHAWIGAKHPTASRLLNHAEEQYEVRFQLRYSVRPWASRPKHDAITGTPGVLWHAEWYTSGREVPVVTLWERLSHREEVENRIVHLLHDGWTIVATFSAVDSPDVIADAIGHIFDDLLTISRPRLNTMERPEAAIDQWKAGAEGLPRRVQVDTALAMLDYELPFSVLGG
jgi:hypothetical protein